MNMNEKNRTKADVLIDSVKDKIYRDCFSSYDEFKQEMELIRKKFEEQTKSSKSNEKWNYFNELKESLLNTANEIFSSKMKA